MVKQKIRVTKGRKINEGNFFCQYCIENAANNDENRKIVVMKLKESAPPDLCRKKIPRGKLVKRPIITIERNFFSIFNKEKGD